MHKAFDLTEIPQLETRRLILRQLTPEDVTALLKHFGNPEVVKFLEMNPLKTIHQANEWLKWMQSFFASKDGLRWGVVLKEGDGSVIGSAGLGGWNREANYAEIGYDIVRPYWRQGYGTEVARALVEFAWEHMNLNRIEAEIVAGNEASSHILKKLGFKQEGVLRQRVFKGGQYWDVLLFGLLRHEYIPEHAG